MLWSDYVQLPDVDGDEVTVIWRDATERDEAYVTVKGKVSKLAANVAAVLKDSSFSYVPPTGAVVISNYHMRHVRSGGCPWVNDDGIICKDKVGHEGPHWSVCLAADGTGERVPL